MFPDHPRILLINSFFFFFLLLLVDVAFLSLATEKVLKYIDHALVFEDSAEDGKRFKYQM